MRLNPAGECLPRRRVRDGDSQYLHKKHTRPQYNVLRLLRGAGREGHPGHEISARVVENAPDVTRILDRLVASGYVKRARSTKDGRESVAKITRKGLTLLLAVDKSVAAAEREIGSCLSFREWRSLANFCQRLFPAPGRAS